MSPNVTPEHAEVLRTLVALHDGKLCERCQCCEMTWEHCDNCEDGFSGHDCGEDTCCCLYPAENLVCGVCNGEGGWWRCLGQCDAEGHHAKEEL